MPTHSSYTLLAISMLLAFLPMLMVICFSACVALWHDSKRRKPYFFCLGVLILVVFLVTLDGAFEGLPRVLRGLQSK
jgi:hypothetical protein